MKHETHDELARRRAILFTDLRGSTEASLALSSDDFQALMRRHDDVLWGSAYKFGGVQAQGAGDGYFILFPSVAAALQSAEQAQRGCDEDVKVRMAIHWVETGLTPIVRRTVVGNEVQEHIASGQFDFKEHNEIALASRVSAIAIPRQILLTAEAFDELKTPVDEGWAEWGNRALRSFSGQSFTIYERLWNASSFGEPGTRYVPTWYPGAINSYVERKKIEQDIRDHLSNRRDPGKTVPVAPIITLTGSGGMGKTRLAISVAVHTSPMFEDHVRFFDFSFAVLRHEEVLELVKGETRAVGDERALFSGFLTVLRDGLGIEPKKHQDGGTDVIEALESLDTMLVLDNLETVICPPVQDFLAGVIRRCRKLVLICTSRQALGLTEGIFPVDLDVGLDPDEAVTLFITRWIEGSPHGSSPAEEIDQNLVRKIVKEIDCIPLAIELVAAAAMDREPLDGIFASLNSNRQLTLSTPARRRRNDDDLTGRRHASMRNSLWWSYRHLQAKTSQRLVETFVKLGCFAGEFRTGDFLAIVDDGSPSDLLDLLSYSMLRRKAGEWWFMHREVREFATDRFYEREDREAILDTFEQVYTQFVLSNGLLLSEVPETLDLMTRLAQNWVSAIHRTCDKTMAGDDNSRKLLDNLLGALVEYVFFVVSDPGDIIKYARTALASCNDLTGEGQALRLLGDVELARHEYEQALEYYEQAADFARKAGSDGLLATSLMRQSDVYTRLGILGKALKLCRESQELAVSLGAKDHDAHCELIIAEILAKACRDIEAEASFQRALEKCEGLPGMRQHSADCQIGLGRIQLYYYYDFEKALELFKQARDEFRKIGDLAGEHIASMSILEATRRLNRDEDVESLLRESLNSSSNAPTDFERIDSLLRLAQEKLHSGAPEEAREAFTGALDLCSFLSGDLSRVSARHLPFIAQGYAGLGRVYERLDEFDQSLHFFGMAQAIYDHRKDDHSRAVTLKDTGYVHARIGSIQEARDYYKKAMVIFDEIGDIHGQAECLERAGEIAKYEFAHEFFEKAGGLYNKSKDRSSEAHCLAKSGDVANFEGNLAGAFELWSRAFIIFEDLKDLRLMASIRIRMALASADAADRTRYCQQAYRLLKLLGKSELIEQVFHFEDSPCFGTECE